MGSKMLAVTLGVLFGVCLFAMVVGQQQCSSLQVDYCLSLLKYDDDISGIIPIYREDQLKAHCNDFILMESCLEPFRSYCPWNVQLFLQGREDSLDYLCEETFDEYLTHAVCFRDWVVRSGVDECNDTFVSRLDEITEDVFHDQICQVADDFSNCLFDAVFLTCGHEAATWVQEFQQRSIEPVLGATTCRYTQRSGSYSSNDILPIVIVVSAVALFLASMIAVCVARGRRQKRIREQEPGVYHTAHPAGPGSSSNYPGPPPSVMIGPPTQNNYPGPPPSVMIGKQTRNNYPGPPPSVMMGASPPAGSVESPPPYSTYSKPPSYSELMRNGQEDHG